MDSYVAIKAEIRKMSRFLYLNGQSLSNESKSEAKFLGRRATSDSRRGFESGTLALLL
jgi:hypothetical protein